MPFRQLCDDTPENPVRDYFLADWMTGERIGSGQKNKAEIL
jgi:hypothetical protein